MLAARRQVSRPLRQLVQKQAGRRYAHDDHGHGHAEHHGPVSEGFGRSFYLTILLVPSAYLLYVTSQPKSDSEPHPWTKILSSYSDWKEDWTKRNSLHTKMVEQAGRDKALFQGSPMPNYIDLNFPEGMTTCSPINVSASQSSVDVSKLLAGYQEKQYKAEAAKFERLKEGKIAGQEPYMEIKPKGSA